MKPAIQFAQRKDGVTLAYSKFEKGPVLVISPPWTTSLQFVIACIEKHCGRVVDAVGDNLLADFESAVDAVQCAADIQKKLKDTLRSVGATNRFNSLRGKIYIFY